MFALVVHHADVLVGERQLRVAAEGLLEAVQCRVEQALLVGDDALPGVDLGLAAVEFDLPLTLRGVSSSLVLTTGHDLKGASLPDWARLAISGATVAVYMGRSNAADVATRLIEAGLAADTAVAVAENAGRTEARLFHGTLSDLPLLASMSELSGPVMTIIGDAVAGGRFDRSVPLTAALAAASAKEKVA